jgi:hypothetical protein
MWRFPCGHNENDKDVGFTPRFPVDKYLAVRTLCVLKSHDLSLVRFLKSVHTNWRQTQLWADPAADFVAKVSFAAYLLSYRNPIDKSRYELVRRLRQDPKQLAQAIDSDRERLSNLVEKGEVKAEFDRWRTKERGKNRPTEGPGAMYFGKRLWCALRDDLRESFFENAWGDGFPSDKDSLLPHLEITADLWNERFRKNAVAPWAKDVLDFGYHNTEKIGAWEVRGLYLKLWQLKEFPKRNYFPMQTDIAFDFAPRMCDASVTKPEVCTNLCPFGGFRDWRKLCVGNEPRKGNDGKYCPLLLYTCGHERDCRPDGCFMLTRGLMEDQRPTICRGVK